MTFICELKELKGQPKGYRKQNSNDRFSKFVL